MHEVCRTISCIREDFRHCRMVDLMFLHGFLLVGYIADKPPKSRDFYDPGCLHVGPLLLLALRPSLKSSNNCARWLGKLRNENSKIRENYDQDDDDGNLGLIFQSTGFILRLINLPISILNNWGKLQSGLKITAITRIIPLMVCSN